MCATSRFFEDAYLELVLKQVVPVWELSIQSE